MQSALYAFICSLLGSAEFANDVLQETNLVLWTKADEYDQNRAFSPWAYRIAYLQVLAFRKRRQRDRLVFDDGLLGMLAEDIPKTTEGTNDRLSALDECISKLTHANRELIKDRYARGKSLSDIGEKLSRKSNAVGIALFRVRKALAQCVEKSLLRRRNAL
jgi:RNA polymerase sigma-70 factor (ECF subfamily)